MLLGAGGGGPQKVRHSTTIHRAPMRPAPNYNYNPPPPVQSNSSGQYSGGGGAPHAAPSGNNMGAIQGPGRQHNAGPSPAQMRQQRIQDRHQQMQAKRERQQERRQEHQQEVQERKKKNRQFRNFLGNDTTYQDQLNSLNKELQDYILSNKDQRSRVREDFSLARSRMGDERNTAIDNMKNDFAARGLLNSSEFADALGDYDKQYNNQLGDLSTDNSRNISDLLEALGLYRNQNTNERQNARQEAIRRRTEAFGGYTPGGN